MARILMSAVVVGLLTAASPQSQEKGIVHPASGVFVDTLKDSETKKLIMRYKMRAPEKKPEKKHLGLIVGFHGMNGNENSMFGFTTKSLERLGIVDQYVVMCGKSKAAGWSPADDPFVLQWIDWAKKTYPIDPRRVHIVGASNGGAMVKRFGWQNQDQIATVASYCGGGSNFMASSNSKKLKPVRPGMAAETRTEWYFVHGTEDTQVGVDTSQRAARDLKAKGYRYVYRELAGEDHGSIMRVAKVADDCFRLMHALRHKEIVLNKPDRTALASMKSKVMRAKGGDADAMIAEMSRVGGAWGAGPLTKAFKASDEGVRVKATETTAATLYGIRTVMELVKLTKNKSDAVKAAAYRGLTVASNYRYPQAQQFLMQIARSKSKKVEERVMAIGGLAATIELMLLGNFEDQMVVWTLVLLLEDKELEVRKAAFAAFDGKLKDTFGYAPDLGSTELKASMKKWKAWAEKVASPLHEAMSGGR